MNRQIKFRAKRKDNGQWVESMTISEGTIKRKSGNMYFELSEGRWVQVDPSTVSQYTGRDDDFGTPIYEGDITEPGFIDPNDPAQVEKKLLVKFEIYDDQQGYSLDLDSPLKVIGNKWDNPDVEYYEFIDKYNPKL